MSFPTYVKNEYPEFYGYEHPWSIPGNEECGTLNPINAGKKKSEIPDWKVHFTSYEIDGEIRYFPITDSLYKKLSKIDNEVREEEDSSSRCRVPSKKGKGTVLCQEACSHCPYGKLFRDGGLVSLENLNALFGFEPADPESEDFIEEIDKEETLRRIYRLLEERDDLDRKIVSLFQKSSREIGRQLDVPWETIRDRKNSLVAFFKKYFHVD